MTDFGYLKKKLFQRNLSSSHVSANISQQRLREITSINTNSNNTNTNTNVNNHSNSFYFIPPNYSQLNGIKLPAAIESCFKQKKHSNNLPNMSTSIKRNQSISIMNNNNNIINESDRNSELEDEQDITHPTNGSKYKLSENIIESSKQQHQSILQDNSMSRYTQQNETIIRLEKQIKHLKTMNEYFQISLKQKDEVFKAIVAENIKLKQQILQLTQEKSGKNRNGNSQDPSFFINSPKLQLLQDQGNNSTASQHARNVYPSPSSKQSFTYKPPRVNNDQTSDVPTTDVAPHQIPRSSKSQDPPPPLLMPISQSKKNSIPLAKLNFTQKFSTPQNKNAPVISMHDSAAEVDLNPYHLKLQKDNPNNNNNNNNNSSKSNINISAKKLFGQLTLQNMNIDEDGTNKSFFIDNGQRSSFEQLAGLDDQPIQQPPKTEIKSEFVSHSTDFAFITRLLDLKSNAGENQRTYNDNKQIQQMRLLVSDERVLKKTILNLSKSNFGGFYDCLAHTLESSDLFFLLTNKLKKIVNAIINIHLQVESTEAFQMIVKEACNVLNCDRASVFLVNQQTQELWTKIAKGSGVIKVPFGQGLVGFVANTMKPLNILDAHKDSRFNAEIDKKNNYNTKSVLCVPVIDSEKGTLVGVMQAINKLEGFFTKDDEGCLQIMAVHAMNVLRNSISHDEKQKNQSMVKNLLNISVKLSKYKSIEELIPRATNMLCSYLDTTEVRFFLLDQLKDKIYSFIAGERVEFEGTCGLAGYAISNKQNENIDNAYNHTNFNQLVDINTSMPLSIYIVWDHPKKKNQIFGVIEIVNLNGLNNINSIKSQKQSSAKFDQHIRLFCEVIASKLKQFIPKGYDQKNGQKIKDSNNSS